MKTELDRIRALAARFAAVQSDRVRLGIGDDAAVIGPSGPFGESESLVWTVDAQVEGTHFRLDWLDWRDVGYRSFMAAASDIAAMGALPIGVLSSLVLAPNVDDDAFDALTEGQLQASMRSQTPIIGGNLARGTETSVTTTVLGSLRGGEGGRQDEPPFTRHAARAGDVVWLGGAVGLAAAGMAALQRKETAKNVQDARIDECIHAWRSPLARFDLSMMLRAHDATGASSRLSVIDVSDGLALDVSRIAEESYITIVLDEVLLSALAPESLRVCAELVGRSVLDLQLYGGEDYALVVTAPEDATLPGFERIGVVIERGDHALMIDRAGSRTPLEADGFDHFAK